MQNQFIVIEGLEGSGKTTAIQAVIQFLNQINITNVVQTREPGGTPVAEKIRNLVKSVSDEVIVPTTELLLMYACRAQLVEHVIQPALARGEWVVSDRFAMSTYAYQGGGRGISESVIKAIHYAAIGDFAPDMTIYMDIDPVIGLERAMSRGELDRFEQQQVDFFIKTRKKYLELAKQDDTIFMVDASKDIATVHQSIQQVLVSYIQH